MSRDKYLEEFRRLVKIVSNTTQEFADYFGISVRTLYRWLSGEKAVPTFVLRALQLLVAKK